jgi:hypothetical protein
MNSRFDFDNFERDFRAASAACLKILVERYNALPYYGLCLYVDSFDGEFALYANTESAFEKVLRYYRAKYGERYSEPEQIKSLKYECGDWEYQTIGRPEDLRACFEQRMRRWSTAVFDLSYRGGLTHDEYRYFDEAGCRVAMSLAVSAELAELNRTDDFTMLVADHDEPPLAAIDRLKWFEENGSLLGFQPVNYGPDHLF